ncbi:hypothetical protein D3C77_443020 [compost metagenome]
MQIDQMIKHLLADIRDAALTDPRHQIEATEGTDGQRQYQYQKQGDGLVEQLRGAGHETLVDQQPNALAHRQGDASGDNQGEQSQYDLLAIWTNETPAQTQGLALARRNAIEHEVAKGQRF